MFVPSPDQLGAMTGSVLLLVAISVGFGLALGVVLAMAFGRERDEQRPVATPLAPSTGWRLAERE